jgi:hypothetical protein
VSVRHAGRRADAADRQEAQAAATTLAALIDAIQRDLATEDDADHGAVVAARQ